MDGDNNRYKRNLEVGDVAITKRTAHRYNIRENVLRNNIESVTSSDSSDQEMSDQSCSPLEQYDVEQEYMPDTERTADEVIDDCLQDALFNDELNDFMKAGETPSSLEEFLANPDVFSNIKTPVNKNRAEVFLMILKFCVSNSLSVTAMTNLFKLINLIFDTPILPDSQYNIDKILNSDNYAEFHAVCPNCSAYLGKFEDITSRDKCDMCNIELDLRNPSNTSFFVLINPSKQIADLLTMYDDHYKFVVNERQHQVDILEDVYDGKEYRKFVNTLPEEEKQKYITGIFNTDGAPKFKCSQYSIWPLYLMINELPKQERMNKLITCGLWFNKHKPDMSTFLNPFVDMINKISGQGIPVVIQGEEQNLKLYILECCVDSVARAPIQGVKQFNGRFGCNWCLHPGQYYGGSMKYPILNEDPEARDHETTVDLMYHASPQYPLHGIKYPSPLINLTYFNVITGFVPDYMHCSLEGVAVQLLNYYMSSMNETTIREIDLALINIATPNQVSRLTRSLSCFKDWKAREIENFILYYSIPLLTPYLSKNLLNHWILFVESTYILLKKSIHITELNRADELLQKFVTQTEQYFGIHAMTFNIHQMLHISESVLNWGPLWCHSTFGFESANHDLLKAIKCSKGVTQQIVRFVNINHNVLILDEYVYPEADIIVKMYCDCALSSRLQNIYKSNHATYFGKPDTADQDIINLYQLSEECHTFNKMVKEGCLYESYKRFKRRSNNSFAQLRNKTYIRIVGFIVDETEQKERTICNKIRTKNLGNYYNALQEIEEIESSTCIVPTKKINTICVFMKVFDKMFICPLPNLLHY